MASERDPHNIVPAEFWDEYGSIEAARRAPSTTDQTEQERCPECDSINIHRKPNQISSHPDHRTDARYRCHKCGTHFDEPLPPEAEIDDTGGAE